jgi:predicted transcriptional regulator
LKKKFLKNLNFNIVLMKRNENKYFRIISSTEFNIKIFENYNEELFEMDYFDKAENKNVFFFNNN